MVHIDVMSCNAVLSAGDGQKLGYIGASKIFFDFTREVTENGGVSLGGASIWIFYIFVPKIGVS